MPLIASYSWRVLAEELGHFGIHLLEKFPDNQIRWGTEPPPAPGTKFKGRSVMTAPYIYLSPGVPRFDIFTIRNILERLGKADQTAAFEKKLEPRINED
jgi:hypothetical protein